MRRDGREYGPTLIDCPFIPLKDKQQRINAARSAGDAATRRAKAVRPQWDSQQALDRLSRVFADVYEKEPPPPGCGSGGSTTSERNHPL